jgi:4-hydroxy-tetrahydrodipicolinate synthase
MAALNAGADGFIDCFPNVWLPGAYDLLRAVEGGHLEEARSLQATGRRLTELFTSNGRSLYPSTKAAMEMLGYRAGKPRPPLQPLLDEQLDELRTGLRSLGVSGVATRAKARQ